MFHGHGTGSEDSKDNTRLYLQRVDRHLLRTLNANRVPLVLAGVEYMCSLFRKVSHYPNILPDAGIRGNPERFRPQELHRKAWDLVQSEFLKDLRRDQEHLQTLLHTEKATTRIETIMPLAYEGRVETLFVSSGGHIWGVFDPASHRIEMSDTKRNNEQDLLDMTAAETIRHRGRVYAIKEEEMPERSKIAAIFRY